MINEKMDLEFKNQGIDGINLSICLHFMFLFIFDVQDETTTFKSCL